MSVPERHAQPAPLRIAEPDGQGPPVQGMLPLGWLSVVGAGPMPVPMPDGGPVVMTLRIGRALYRVTYWSEAAWAATPEAARPPAAEPDSGGGRFAVGPA